MKFQFDSGNTRHLFTDHPERNNSREEIESVFADPKFVGSLNRITPSGEERFHGVGTSNQNRVLYVVFVVRNGEIRPFSCRPASKEERKSYANS